MAISNYQRDASWLKNPESLTAGPHKARRASASTQAKTKFVQTTKQSPELKSLLN